MRARVYDVYNGKRMSAVQWRLYQPEDPFVSAFVLSEVYCQTTTRRKQCVCCCPECHETTWLPEGGVALLPLDLPLCDRVEQHLVKEKISSSSPPLCQSCEDEPGSSVAYCKDCNYFLCEICWKAHQQFKSTHSHSSFQLHIKDHSNIAKEQATFQSSKDSKCLSHSLVLKYYCTRTVPGPSMLWV